MFASTKDACERIVKLPAPILFLDTCIFLDILRTPYRKNISPDNISSALAISQLADSEPPKIWLITNETVHGELEANIENVKKELTCETEKQEKIHDKFIRCANATFKQNFQHGQKVTQLQLSDHLQSLSNNIMRKCLVIRVEDSHSLGAMDRIRKYLAPASKGKQEAKDCEIFEAFLDVSKKIREGGVTEKIFFITSNTKDYGNPSDSFVKSEFCQISATYVNNLSWALSEVSAVRPKHAAQSAGTRKSSAGA